MREITSRTNSVITQTSLLKKNGGPEGYILEGDKFITDTSAESFVSVFTTDPDRYADFLSSLSCEVYRVTDPVMEKLSSSDSGCSLLAVLKKKEQPLPGRLVLLDCVQDPGNVGTIIRTAFAFGFGVVCGNGCSNPFLPKTVRSTAGAITYCPVIRNDLGAFINDHPEYKYFGTCLDEKAVPLHTVSESGPVAVIVGSEGRGISAEILDKCDGRIYIPISNVESLNAAVAAAISIYHFSLK